MGSRVPAAHPHPEIPKVPPTPGQKSHHGLMCSRSRCRQAPSSRLFIGQKHLVSSAKRETEVVTSPEGHSVTYMRNKRGPSIDPCRTPDNTGRGGPFTPRTVTLWTWSVRQSSNQVNRALQMPNRWSFLSSSLWLTLSKALTKSR